MTMGSPTARQLEYVDELRLRATMCRPQIGDINAFDDARDAIDRLLKMRPISHGSRQGIFASLRDAGKTKKDLYAAIDVTSLAADSNTTEHDAARARAWIRDEAVERYRRPVQPTVAAAIDDFVAVALPTGIKFPRRLWRPLPKPVAPPLPISEAEWTNADTGATQAATYRECLADTVRGDDQVFVNRDPAHSTGSLVVAGVRKKSSWTEPPANLGA
jgi:hypothetical protein